ncbi:MAG: Kae1-associated serine/threonine protein kinase [Candidatus Aenigmarchaeota archaeon]|nr:Kae1-associated serine/threonine protein kinase [Candidatus Aenigmarchaeota archaeon]
MKDIIQRGAEAVLYKDELEGKTVLVKERIKKGYRVEQLDDEIRSSRTRHEARLMERAIGSVNVPRILKTEKFKIIMDFIEGRKLKEALLDMDKKEVKNACSEIGKMAASTHNLGIIHGDLTTSNFIVEKDTGKIFLIDFGLGKFERKVEARAVDLHLLYEALKSTHFDVLDIAWDSVTDSYSRNVEDWKKIESRIEQIKKRRRYK